MSLPARLICGGVCLILGTLAIAALALDTKFFGPSEKYGWPAVRGLAIISLGVGFLTLP